MPKKCVVLLAFAACLPGYAAKADFRLQTAAHAAPGLAITGEAGSHAPIAPDLPVTDDEDPAPPVKPRVPYARGFGHAVPLSFAARQIVPRNVAIRFGAGVDQSLPVDWSGGRPWNVVMGAAVKPLHLHLTFSRTSVLIS